MLKTTLFLGLNALALYTHAQKQAITWGDEFKLKKGSNNISVVYTDKSGV
jgi:hypothetical protein